MNMMKLIKYRGGIPPYQDQYHNPSFDMSSPINIIRFESPPRFSNGKGDGGRNLYLFKAFIGIRTGLIRFER
jgi:hypothetical protein